MKRRDCVIAVCAAGALLVGCDEDRHDSLMGTIVGSGRRASESRPSEPFTALAVHLPAHVELRLAPTTSLEVTADDNVLPFVRSETRGGELELRLAPSHFRSIGDIVIRATTPSLEAIEASGAASLEVDRIDTARLRVALTGACSLRASGRADRLDLQLSGASRCVSSELFSSTVVADVSGASYGRVRVRDSLVANVSGASVLEYLGDPTIRSEVSGQSVLRRVGP